MTTNNQQDDKMRAEFEKWSKTLPNGGYDLQLMGNDHKFPVYHHQRTWDAFDGWKAATARMQGDIGVAIEAIGNYRIKLQDFADNSDVDYKIAFDDAEKELNQAITTLQKYKPGMGDVE